MSCRPLAVLILGSAILAPLQTRAAEPPSASAVVEGYADLALAMYRDALREATELDQAVTALLATPSEPTLQQARDAWRAARVPYQRTEAFRFGNPVVDDWEGKVNAWPLDEGLIDYVDASYGEGSDENPLYNLNIIANERIQVGPTVVDATTITPELLANELHEALDVEKNVATGYHAIEFLLWGQDLNGTGPGAGNRPWTDFASGEACTNAPCERRRTYLSAVTKLLLADLGTIVGAWQEDGEAREPLTADDGKAGLSAILTGIGSLSYGELAGERMKLGLLLHDPEEEHDCFADNTHNSHYDNQVGMMAIWDGRYQASDGAVVEKPAIADLAAAKAPEAKAAVDRSMATTLERLGAIKEAADSGKMAYDQMLASDNPEGNAMIQAGVDALVAQARAVEQVVAALDLTIEVEGSDSLDNPSAVAP